MKYSLYNELLDQKDILSHVFFNCAWEFIEEIADKHAPKKKGKTRDEYKDKIKIDIELKIDGHVCNPRKFFEMLKDQYYRNVTERATKLVKEQTSEKFGEIADKLRDVEEIVESWGESINWQMDNPFEKKEVMPECYAINIRETDLSVRALNCLIAFEIHTIGDIMKFSESDLLRTKKFGKKALTSIKEVLKGHKLELKKV